MVPVQVTLGADGLVTVVSTLTEMAISLDRVQEELPNCITKPSIPVIAEQGVSRHLQVELNGNVYGLILHPFDIHRQPAPSEGEQ
jgi:hypothetical protein